MRGLFEYIFQTLNEGIDILFLQEYQSSMRVRKHCVKGCACVRRMEWREHLFVCCQCCLEAGVGLVTEVIPYLIYKACNSCYLLHLVLLLSGRVHHTYTHLIIILLHVQAMQKHIAILTLDTTNIFFGLTAELVEATESWPHRIVCEKLGPATCTHREKRNYQTEY